MESKNTCASLKSQSTPKPQSPIREDNHPTKDPVEMETENEDVFSAVAVANGQYYDEKIIQYAITGVNPNKAEIVEPSKKEEEAVKDILEVVQAEREFPIDLNQEPQDEEIVQAPRRSSRERRINSKLRDYELKF
ncbi:hypothetical protein Lal_00020578 [Lupinus albus]|uniref:Uncharacterized protein n=1 Tax=Lupinus albus TaxID=3870 RepID=A0A6A4Q651_LUPAL|nr:hypothetical protein Lalb_Chr08g0240821 [Lupinus albus]KAF1871783.1 hypothetical protein Lal_00020578 [Lupinus albus]